MSTESKNYKLVLCVRKDLKMGTGKIAVQCSHASVEAVFNLFTSKNGRETILSRWNEQGAKKVALKVDDEAHLFKLYNAAKQKNIHTVYIKDAGKTQLESGTVTVLAIGPATDQEIDSITGSLKLL